MVADNPETVRRWQKEMPGGKKLLKKGIPLKSPLLKAAAEMALSSDFRLNQRFNILSTMMRNEGVLAGTAHKRLVIPKAKLTEKDIHQLGFTPVSISIPEAGQDRFTSFRHEDNEFHLHSHPEGWTMHEDSHAASTMLARKAKGMGAKLKAHISGIPHMKEEGLPGLFYYVRGRLKGHKSTAQQVLAETKLKTLKRIKRLKDRPGITAEMSAVAKKLKSTLKFTVPKGDIAEWRERYPGAEILMKEKTGGLTPGQILTGAGGVVGAGALGALGSQIYKKQVMGQMHHLSGRIKGEQIQKALGLKDVAYLDEEDPFSSAIAKGTSTNLDTGKVTDVHIVIAPKARAEEITAHELGHSTLRKSELAERMWGLGRLASPVGTLGGVLLAGLGRPGLGTAVAAASQIPTLVDEGLASVRGLKGLEAAGATEEELTQAKRNLLKVFGSYGVGAMGLAAMPAAFSAGTKLAAKKEYAPGIPEKGKITPLPTVKKPQAWEFSAHPHAAEKAGPHIDMRLGDPKTGIAHSFVLPKGKLPESGKMVEVIPTNDHTIGYMDFKGEIAKGYGKGKVTSGRRTVAEVYHADSSDVPGTKLRFNLYEGDHPQEYAMVRKGDGRHLLVNKTLTRERRPDIPTGKPKYKEFDIEKLDVTRDQVMMPKLDGAHTLVDLTAGRSPRLFSYRVGKKGPTGLIEHTHKMPQLLTKKVPKSLDGTILRGETLAVDGAGKAIPSEQIAGLLNAKVWTSRERQKEKGVRLKAFPFQVQRYKGKDMTGSSFDEQEKILRRVAKALPDLEIPEMARTPAEKLDLANRIKGGKHPLTSEGVVLTTPGRQPQRFHKGKVTPDFDVFVRDIHAASKKGGGVHDRAGAISYSWTPDGPIIGQLGGFKHDEAKKMLKNPDQYVGRVAKVRAMKAFDGKKPGELGALFQPRFNEWHLDKGDIEKDAGLLSAGLKGVGKVLGGSNKLLKRVASTKGGRSAIVGGLGVSAIAAPMIGTKLKTPKPHDGGIKPPAMPSV